MARKMLALLFAMAFVACAAKPPLAPAEPPKPAPEPTCAELARRAAERAEEADRLKDTAEQLGTWGYLSDWRAVDTGKCRALIFRRSHLLFPDGSLYDYYDPGRPLGIDTGTRALLARIYACRFAQLNGLGDGEPPAGKAPDCPQ